MPTGPRALTHTPAGDAVDLPSAMLPAADALLIMAAHTSRAQILTEWFVWLLTSTLRHRRPPHCGSHGMTSEPPWHALSPCTDLVLPAHVLLAEKPTHVGCLCLAPWRLIPDEITILAPVMLFCVWCVAHRMDPAVQHESDPARRDQNLDLWDPLNPHAQPPFAPAYVSRFRAAQVCCVLAPLWAIFAVFCLLDAYSFSGRCLPFEISVWGAVICCTSGASPTVSSADTAAFVLSIVCATNATLCGT